LWIFFFCHKLVFQGSRKSGEWQRKLIGASIIWVWPNSALYVRIQNKRFFTSPYVSAGQKPFCVGCRKITWTVCVIWLAEWGTRVWQMLTWQMQAIFPLYARFSLYRYNLKFALRSSLGLYRISNLRMYLDNLILRPLQYGANLSFVLDWIMACFSG